jgi:uncharacterized protein YecT (DUF1311 family)
MRMTVGFVLLVGVCGPAAATDDPYLKCSDKAKSNVDYNACGDALLKRADDGLNGAWKIALAAMPGDDSRKALLEEQRAWNAYKEKSCMIYATSDFGREGQVINYPTCRAEVIEARTKYLKALKDN